MGLRSGSTLDRVVVIEATNEDEMAMAIRRLVDHRIVELARHLVSPLDAGQEGAFTSSPQSTL
jgi:hypothetical protein